MTDNELMQDCKSTPYWWEDVPRPVLPELALPSTVDVAVVGDMTTPPAQPGALFLVSCGPGYLSTVEALMGVAQAAGATVFMVTAQPHATLPKRADRLLVLRAQTMAETEGSSSEQAMGSVFEQALWVMFDALIPELQRRLGQSTDDLRRRHTNLE